VVIAILLITVEFLCFIASLFEVWQWTNFKLKDLLDLDKEQIAKK
jgi:hypothetical protein